MDSLEEKIKAFLDIGDGDGDGDGYGDGYGDGDGSGDGYGDGYGDGSGSGSGSGDGSGYGDGYGDGDGSGSGSGSGSGYGSGYGDGYGDGDGSGYGDGYGIEEFDGHKLYDIDGVPTAITSVIGNYAEGFTIEYNSVKVPCFIARVDNCFAHGDNLREAVAEATAKAMERKPIEERIADTIKKYPDPLEAIPNTELFNLHHVLTGSCEYGRKQFCTNHGISIDGSMTMEEFISLTINDYGGNFIEMLAKAYGFNTKNKKE